MVESIAVSTKLNSNAIEFKPAQPVTVEPEIATIPENEEIPARQFNQESLSTPSTISSSPSICNCDSPVPVFVSSPVYVAQTLPPPNYSFLAIPVAQTNVALNPLFTQQAQVNYFDDAYSTCSDSSLSPEPSTFIFEPKVKSNHSKGNFYISEEMILRMMLLCKERFTSSRLNDKGLAFSYFKQSVAMSINDAQIEIVQSRQGLVIFIDIDLHLTNGQKMYLIAMENVGYIEKVRWNIVDIMSKQQLFDQFQVKDSYLPASSRKMAYFQEALNFPPFNVSMRIVDNIKFHKLPKKEPKEKSKITRISVSDFQFYCKEALRSNNYMVIPVVVIKGKRTWIEWKVPIRVYNGECVCISLKYNAANRRWSIACLDFDVGRLCYQHRLVGLPPSHRWNYSYDQLAKCCTTSLEFVR